jgi:hypothetical protein
MPGKRKMRRHQALPQTHHWLWPAVCEAHPTEGDGPDAGGSAFFFGTFFWASKRKYRCRAKMTSPGRRERTKTNGVFKMFFPDKSHKILATSKTLFTFGFPN